MNESVSQNPATPRPSAADLIRRGESLMVEFKSDRKCLPDRKNTASLFYQEEDS